MENFGLDVTIEGKPVEEYISNQLEKIEKLDVQLEKEKIKNSYIKQMNNHSRLRLDASKFEFNRYKFNVEHKEDLAEKV